MTTLGTSRAARHHTGRGNTDRKKLHRRPTSCHSITTTPAPTSAELTTRQHSSNKTTALRLDSSSSSYHNDSKIALQTTTMIPMLSSSNTWLTEQQLTNQPCQKEKEKKGINTQLSWQTVASVGPPKTHHQDRNQLITPQQLQYGIIQSLPFSAYNTWE